MRRFPWDILLALLFGLGLGLAYSWVISPLHVFNSDPTALRMDFKDQFRSAIAAAYTATNNLPRAEARLSLLGETDLAESLNSQAQRMIASGEFTQADQLAALAMVLENGDAPVAMATTPTTNGQNTGEPISLETLPASSEEIPFELTETPEFFDTPSVETQTIETPDR